MSMQVNQINSSGGAGTATATAPSTSVNGCDVSGDLLEAEFVDPSLSMSTTLPANKEVRIQLALQYFKQQQQRDLPSQNTSMTIGGVHRSATGGHAPRPKQSLRQIAMFFQIPKSTLYDRLKNSKKQRSTSNSVGPTTKTVPKVRVASNSNSNSTSHLIQMKLDPAREEQLFLYLRKVCLAYGNLPNLVQLKFLVSQEIKHITLGRKWVSNFIKRHNDQIIYGWEVFHNPIKFEDFKKWKNQFTFLWIWFVPLLQEIMRKCMSNGEVFYYLVRVPISYEVLASCFIGFKVDPDMTLGLAFEPELVTFRNNNSSLMHKEERIKTLNGILQKCYRKLPHNAKLVVFEGFNDQYHWDFEDCIRLVNPENFIALPWGRHILSRLIEFGPELVRIYDPQTVKLSWNETHFKLQDIKTELKMFMSLSTDTSSAIDISLPALSATSAPPSRPIDIELQATNTAATAAVSVDDDEDENNDDNGDNENDNDNDAASVAVAILEHQSAATHTAAATATTSPPIACTDALPQQLKDIVATIDDHEDQLYNNLRDPNSKVILNNIFNRLRSVVDNDTS
ncbi:uncharacterized protein Ecym_6048 [Eremothecium cymbalariae DBVPG|uniref:Uncharacterized protein n=1 Tax=Eremothecium cymbalariae (strain CBS 270.75 / DBVPG 7215 / KCTC 17166 / NRRL Y-17582) TaxID=931890 RepID=G8JUX2_ERECY|nr:hypothetical protein Ecym_6048 [Eremothecium cymbalariae DBVPG\